MTPMHAKMMLKALAENLQKYEAQFGEIKLPAGGSGLAEQFFSHGKPPTLITLLVTRYLLRSTSNQ